MKNYGISLLLLAAVLLAACQTKTRTLTLPKAPLYEDSTQWYITDRDAEADIFYITSTETGDYPAADGTVSHFADTYRDSTRAPLLAEMAGVDTLISGALNFYTPYYRQCSLQTFASDSLMGDRLPVAIDDVRRAFAHYLENYNQGRPFVLAGFSQGAVIAIELLKEMDAETYKRLVAVYALGTSISQQTVDGCGNLRPAQGADDTGVTINYNSVRDATCGGALWQGNVVAINPVNWRTDGTPAELITEPTPLLPVSGQKKDTLTVRLDSVSHFLLVSGYSATDYVLPLIGQEGNYHSREIWLYRDQLRQNIALRTSRMMEKTNNTNQ
jgi:hypothetical protein